MSELEQKMFGKDLFGHAMRPASSGPIDTWRGRSACLTVNMAIGKRARKHGSG